MTLTEKRVGCLPLLLGIIGAYMAGLYLARTLWPNRFDYLPQNLAQTIAIQDSQIACEKFHPKKKCVRFQVLQVEEYTQGWWYVVLSPDARRFQTLWVDRVGRRHPGEAYRLTGDTPVAPVTAPYSWPLCHRLKIGPLESCPSTRDFITESELDGIIAKSLLLTP